jgi:nucleobase transporter 1/2
MSILDSIGDYYACAKVTRVPAPPKHAVNRGILIEGICTFLSGAVGCGHATSTYGGSIGAIGVTKVRFLSVVIFMINIEHWLHYIHVLYVNKKVI